MVALLHFTPMRPEEHDHGDPLVVGRELLEWFGHFADYYGDTAAVARLDAPRLSADGLTLSIALDDTGGAAARRTAWTEYWLRLAFALAPDEVNRISQQHGLFTERAEDPRAVLEAGPLLVELGGGMFELRGSPGAWHLERDGDRVAADELPDAERELCHDVLVTRRGADALTTLAWPDPRHEAALRRNLGGDEDQRRSALWYLRHTATPAPATLHAVLHAPHDDLRDARDTLDWLAGRLGPDALPILREALAAATTGLPVALALSGLASLPSATAPGLAAEAADAIVRALTTGDTPVRLTALELTGRFRHLCDDASVIAGIVDATGDHDEELVHAALLGLFNLFLHRQAPPSVLRAFRAAAHRHGQVGVFARWAAGALEDTANPG